VEHTSSNTNKSKQQKSNQNKFMQKGITYISGAIHLKNIYLNATE